MIVLDSNIIVALLDNKDVHHNRAISMLEDIGDQKVYLLSVCLIEVYSVVARRCRERKYNSRSALNQLRSLESALNIIWIGDHQAAHNDIVDWIIETKGKLSYIDAYILNYVISKKSIIKTFDKYLLSVYKSATK